MSGTRESRAPERFRYSLLKEAGFGTVVLWVLNGPAAGGPWGAGKSMVRSRLGRSLCRDFPEFRRHAAGQAGTLIARVFGEALKP